MPGDRTAIAQTLRAFSAQHANWVLFDEPSETVLEVASGKSLRLPLGEVAQAIERRNTRTGLPYLLIEMQDGRELALSEVGVAFPPVRPSVPQAPELPPVVCLGDFEALRGRLDHLVFAHPEEAIPREALDLVMLCLAILEGARHIGFDIGREEKALDGLLTAIEQRK